MSSFQGTKGPIRPSLARPHIANRKPRSRRFRTRTQHSGSPFPRRGRTDRRRKMSVPFLSLWRYSTYAAPPKKRREMPATVFPPPPPPLPCSFVCWMELDGEDSNSPRSDLVRTPPTLASEHCNGHSCVQCTAPAHTWTVRAVASTMQSRQVTTGLPLNRYAATTSLHQLHSSPAFETQRIHATYRHRSWR